MSALDQSLAQAALPAQTAFEAQHATVVLFVIVAEEVQEAVQGEDPELGAFRVTRCAGLVFGDTSRDDDVPEEGNRDSGFGIRALPAS